MLTEPGSLTFFLVEAEAGGAACTQLLDHALACNPLLRAAQSNAVTAGLAALFESFSDAMSARDGGEPGVERSRSVVAPTELREALAALNAHKFGIGAPSGGLCAPKLAHVLELGGGAHRAARGADRTQCAQVRHRYAQT